MEALRPTLDWILANPAGFAWVLFGLLTGFVALYRAQEAKIKALVEKTETQADDRLVRLLDTVVAIVETLALLVPHGLGRPRTRDEG